MRIFDIIDVNESNVEETGFFCAMSKPGSLGYQAKLAWLKERFREGLKLKMVLRGGRGFIEYMPGEFAWRAIEAPGYMVIHCLWVVGREKKRGCGTALLEECIEEARSLRMHGVAMVTAIQETGLCGTGFLLKHGFRLIDTAPPALDLVALKFHRNAPDPRFSRKWDTAAEPGSGDVKVVYTHQCPYVYAGLEELSTQAEARGFHVRAENLASARQVREEAPSAYGSFAVCRGDNVLSHLINHNRTRKLMRRIEKSRPAVLS